MSWSEELVVVLLSVYAFSAVWLVLDILLGHSRGAARMRAEGATTLELVAMSVFWPILMVGPWIAVAILGTLSTLRTARAVLAVAWEEISGRD